MKKIAVVYWSGTGNTEQMANAVAEGAKEAGAEVSTLTADQFSAAKVAEFDAIAFGCPAMGAETLEEHRPVRFLRMGRRRMDAHLGGHLPFRRRGARL